MTPLEVYTDHLGWIECVDCSVRKVMSYGAVVRTTRLQTTFTSGQEFCRELVAISTAANQVLPHRRPRPTRDPREPTGGYPGIGGEIAALTRKIARS